MRTSEERIKIYEIAVEMRHFGLDADFVCRAVDLALKFRGGYGLMKLWAEEDDKAERDAIVADLQHEIEDFADAGSEPEKLTYINFEALVSVSEQLTALKQKLRGEIESYGGITKLAKETGIAQPYLSRLFTSGIKPRRRTLAKICNALGKKPTELGFIL